MNIRNVCFSFSFDQEQNLATQVYSPRAQKRLQSTFWQFSLGRWTVFYHKEHFSLTSKTSCFLRTEPHPQSHTGGWPGRRHQAWNHYRERTEVVFRWGQTLDQEPERLSWTEQLRSSTVGSPSFPNFGFLLQLTCQRVLEKTVETRRAFLLWRQHNSTATTFPNSTVCSRRELEGLVSKFKIWTLRVCYSVSLWLSKNTTGSPQGQ